MKLHLPFLVLVILMLSLTSSAQPLLPVPNAPGVRDISSDLYAQHILGTNGSTNYPSGLGQSNVFIGTGANRILASGAPIFRTWNAEYQTGAVVFYHQVNGQWMVKSILTDTHNPPQPYGDFFGTAIALSGETTPALLAVSAPYKDISNVVNAGIVYIYRYENENWVEEAAVVPPVPSDNLQFGSALALTGTGDDATLFVGAPYDDPGGLTDAGAVYVYKRSGTTWLQQEQLTDGENRPNTAFGFSVSAAGTGDDIGVIVSSGNDEQSMSYRGAATIFGRSGSHWSKQHRFESPFNLFMGEDFVSGTGAILHNGVMYMALATTNPPSNSCIELCSGRIDVFTRSGMTWSAETIEHQYTVGQSVTFASLGSDLHLLSGSRWGYVHLFQKAENGWPHTRVFSGTGQSVTAAGDTALFVATGIEGSTGTVFALYEPFSKLEIFATSTSQITEDSTPIQLQVKPYGSPTLITYGAPNNPSLTLTPDANCDLGMGAGVPVSQWINNTGTNYFDVSAVDDSIIEGTHQCNVSTMLWFSDAPNIFIGDSITLTINDDDYPSFLINGSFENKLSGWTILNRTKDKVICAGDEGNFDDSCWMSFLSSKNENTLLRQVVTDFKGVVFETGMTLRLQFLLQSRLAMEGNFKAKFVIKYAGGTTATKVVRTFTDSSGDLFTIMDAQLVSPKIKKVKVEFIYTGKTRRGLPSAANLDHVILTLPDADFIWWLPSP